MNDAKKFDRRLKDILDLSGVSREELAQHLGVAVPVLNRWLNGAAAPDVYQFQAIAQFFGLPYAWFLDGGGGFPSAEEIAARLGLAENTVEALLELAEERDENEAVLDAIDIAIQSVLAVAGAVWEDLDRYAGQIGTRTRNWERWRHEAGQN